MVVIVPEAKRIANLEKHNIDLAEFESSFSWDRYLMLPARPSRTGRVREMYLGFMHARLVAAVVSPLGAQALAVISVPPAAEKERAAYDQFTRLEAGR